MKPNEILKGWVEKIMKMPQSFDLANQSIFGLFSTDDANAAAAYEKLRKMGDLQAIEAYAVFLDDVKKAPELTFESMYQILNGQHTFWLQDTRNGTMSDSLFYSFTMRQFDLLIEKANTPDDKLAIHELFEGEKQIWTSLLREKCVSLDLVNQLFERAYNYGLEENVIATRKYPKKLLLIQS